MIKIENVITPSAEQWKATITGMRNPMNSWNRMDSKKYVSYKDVEMNDVVTSIGLGENDLNLMRNLFKGGTEHRKYLRMLHAYMDITAPLYWWKEFDTYKIGTVTNSCSTMHKIQAREFTLDDFSHEHLIENEPIPTRIYSAEGMMEATIENLNMFRLLYLKTKDKKYWWQMIQLLPSSYNQKRTVMINYEVAYNIVKQRTGHKLDEWHVLVDELKKLPYFLDIVDGEHNEQKAGG